MRTLKVVVVKIGNEDGKHWNEEYLQENFCDSEQLGKDVVNHWNNSLRPGEMRRVFLGVVGEYGMRVECHHEEAL